RRQHAAVDGVTHETWVAGRPGRAETTCAVIVLGARVAVRARRGVRRAQAESSGVARVVGAWIAIRARPEVRGVRAGAAPVADVIGAHFAVRRAGCTWCFELAGRPAAVAVGRVAI